MDIEKWIKENCTSEKKYKRINNIDYVFCTMRDGWIAVLEKTCSGLEPVIQAKDEQRAMDYVTMIEELPVPFNIL